MTCGVFDLRRVFSAAGVGFVLSGSVLTAAVLGTDEPASAAIQERDEARQQGAGPETVRRPGSVVLSQEYDLAGLTLPLEQIHTLLPRDAIPALTDPETEPASEVEWLDGTDRLAILVIQGEAYAAPLKVLNYHEIVNTTVGGQPVALTYCPLCDSVTAFNRRVTQPNGDPTILEFGVSGALYNSNVLMYDRTYRGLWSQLGMHAASGPLQGTALAHLSARVVSLARFRAEHPEGRVVTKNTGHTRPYEREAYAAYFETDDTLVPVWGVGDAIRKKKTLGVGVIAGEKSWFISAEAIGNDGMRLQTPLGPVELRVTEAGIDVASAPEGVSTAQTFYYSWSAFHPKTEVITD
ncbi:MAG: DUF3179 domain-containing (seleno)protein [Planctomycetota bacterium]